MRYWLVDLPARIFDLYCLAYPAILAVAGVACLAAAISALLLAALGIRWGW
jgi:hypothetical protein